MIKQKPNLFKFINLLRRKVKMTSYKVQLYIYDLSGGFAATISPMLLGKKIDGVWHTSIVVYNREYFFGSRGVETCNPGATVLRQPLKIEELGETQIPYSVFSDYINGLSETTYAASTYHILKHNCNNFSNELAQFLCGATVPKYILDLPNEVLNSRLSTALLSLANQLENSARPLSEDQPGIAPRRERSPDDFEQLNTQIEEARSDSETNGVVGEKKK